MRVLLHGCEPQVVQHLDFEDRPRITVCTHRISPTVFYQPPHDPGELGPDLTLRDPGGCANCAVCAKTSRRRDVDRGFGTNGTIGTHSRAPARVSGVRRQGFCKPGAHAALAFARSAGFTS